jgi:hypothetical protein
MTILKPVQIIIFAMMMPLAAFSQTTASVLWKPANYRGLIMGKSTPADVLRVLGKPKWTGKEEDTGVPIIVYDEVDPVPGSLTVYIHKGTLSSLALSPTKLLSKDDIIRMFGRNFRLIHYSTDDCLDEGGAAPLYEDPKGLFEHMEYRTRGVIVDLAYNDDDKVEAISYIYKSLIPTHSICAARSKHAASAGNSHK